MVVSLPLVACLVLGGLAYYLFFRKTKTKRDGKTPPGPWGLPIFGNILQIDRKNPFMTLSNWAEIYGDLYSVRMGKMQMYVVSDYKMVKEMFSQEPAFSGSMNPGEGINDLYTTGQMHGLFNTEGKPWEELRRFTLRQLRDCGFGKSTMEALIMDELKETMEWLKSQEGKAIGNIKERLTVAVVNSLWTVVTGQRYKHDDPVVLALTKDLSQALDDAASTGGIVFFFPWLEKLGLVKGLKAFQANLAKSRVMYTKVVEEHKSTYSSDYQRDFIDVFLKEIKSCTDKDSAFYKELGERQLVAVIKDLFDAGTETSSTTLSWVFIYLATFSEVQKKLQKELDSVIGNSRHCGLSDRPHLPYTEALLAEVLRFSSIVPTGVAHRVLHDVVYKGYAFPKGTAIMPNQIGIHFNPNIWGDPKNFRPERFLSPDGKTFKKHEALIPFSIGRRQCAGETLARDTIFLFTANIFQRFEVKFDPSDATSNPGLEPKAGFLLSPQPFKVTLKDRMA